MKRLLVAACLAVVAGAGEFDALRQHIRRQLAETGVPSVAVALARDGVIVWEEGFGWADREQRLPATEHTLYSLASISKPITATGLMVLASRGLIRLDDPIDNYLGAAKINPRAFDARLATVRRVASHSAGLPLHYQFFYADEPYRRPSMEETILRYANLVTPPGERYQYSNLGYGLLDAAIARVSGREFADFMRTEVFLPLGLTRTSVHLTTALEPYAAVRYTPLGRRLPHYDFDHPGGSAIWASAHDLIRFAQFHLKNHLADQKAILTDQAIDEMQQPLTSIDATQSYGIGWFVERRGADTVVSHRGAMGGVATNLRLIPSRNLALAVLSNDARRLPDQLSDEILKQVIPNWLIMPARVQPPPAFKTPPPLAGVWVGYVHTYTAQLPLTLEFLASGSIHARLGTQLETLVNDPEWNAPVFAGRMMGDIGTPDSSRRPHSLQLRLTLGGARLNGSVTALSLSDDRAGNALSHWVDLEKAPAPGEAFRIQPLRPVDVLRREALAAQPPVETGKRSPELVELVTLDPTIKLDIRYAGSNNFLSTPIYEAARAFLQKPAAEALKRAHGNLRPYGFGLLIYDAYRPWYATHIFWNATPPHLRHFVANPAKGSVHNRGCAVDLTLYELASGQAVEMPSAYDEMTPRAYPDYPGGNTLSRWRRDLLRRVMEAEGFTVYASEWWHFDYRNWTDYPLANMRFADIKP
jgi:CubicO group peptidase (beta-lactamase class C family)/D-alanyl-D-alanine dipeptidase